MQRDLDLIRHVLLEIEMKDDGSGRWADINHSKWSDGQVVEHLFQLYEGNLIEGTDTSHLQGRDFKALRLTTWGHDYLDSIRDPKIWKMTKDGASAAGGFTLELVGQLAKGFVKKQIKDKTGIEL